MDKQKNTTSTAMACRFALAAYTTAIHMYAKALGPIPHLHRAAPTCYGVEF